MKLNVIDDAIVQLLNDQGNVAFNFELKTLDGCWHGRAEEHESLNVLFDDEVGEYIIIIMTANSGQSGIVAVVDVASGEILHYHDGAFAISAEIYKDYVITICGVQQWGTKYYNCVEAVRFGTKAIVEGERQVKVDERIGDDFSYEISDNVIHFKDSSGQTADVDLSELLSE